MEGHFSVDAQREGREYVVAVSGELDLAAASSLEAELDRILQSDVTRIVLNLADLAFIDSTGMSVLVRAQQRAHESGRELGLVNPGQQVERLLSLTGLSERLTLPSDT